MSRLTLAGLFSVAWLLTGLRFIGLSFVGRLSAALLTRLLSLLRLLFSRPLTIRLSTVLPLSRLTLTVLRIARLLLGSRIAFVALLPLTLSFLLRTLTRQLRRILRRIASDFAVELLRQILQLFACSSQRFGFVTKHRLSGFLDSFTKLIDAAAGDLFDLLSILDQPTLQRAAGGLQSAIDLLVLHIARRIVQPFGQQRLCLLRLFDRLLHAFGQVREFFLLLVQSFHDLFATVVLPQGLLRGGIGLRDLGELLREFLLFLIEFAGRVTHLTHLFVEAARGSTAEFVAEFLELLFSAGA